MEGEQLAAIEPDTKDWTWTLSRTCPECGFDAAAVPPEEIAARTMALAAPWPQVLARPEASQRPAPTVWSPVEYACHVRDVCRIFDGRLRQMLDEDGVRFANWDQDATAVEEGYAEQSPAVVAPQVLEAAQRLAETFAGVRDEQWQHRGERSDGSQFTVVTLGQYFLHDLAHHLVDVGA